MDIVHGSQAGSKKDLRGGIKMKIKIKRVFRLKGWMFGRGKQLHCLPDGKIRNSGLG